MVSGDNQSGTVGTVLPSAFVVIVKDANGNPVGGVSVVFAVAAGGGSVSATSATTGSDGKASTTLTLGTTAGTNTVTATSTGLSGSPVTFNATGTAGALATITVTPNPVTIATGNNQQFTAAGKDAYNNPVPITPTWSIEGTIGTNTITSSGLFTAGTAGLVTVKATSGGVFGSADVTVILFIVQPSPTNSTVVASPTAVSANGVNTSTVIVTLRDSSNNPISGHSVTISSGTHVTVITPSSVDTNTSGQAVFTVKSSQAGTATITATDATAGVVITNTATITFEEGKWDVMAWDVDVWGS
jgi:adhesin/invasin